MEKRKKSFIYMATASSIVGAIGFLGFGAAPAALADSVEISNDIRVEANTGGNSGATVTSGRASVDVKIHQSVNGEELPLIEISTSSDDSSPRAVEIHTEYASGTVRTDINAHAGAGSSSVSGTAQVQDEIPVVSEVEPPRLLLQSVSRFFISLKAQLNDVLHYVLQLF